jgi:hypothetical protein
MRQTDTEVLQKHFAFAPVADDQMVKILRAHFADERLYALDLTPTIRFILMGWLRSAKAEVANGESEPKKRIP